MECARLYPVPEAPETLFVDEALLDCNCSLCSVAVGAGVAVGAAVAVATAVAFFTGDFTVAEAPPVALCVLLWSVECVDVVAEGAGVAVAAPGVLTDLRTVLAWCVVDEPDANESEPLENVPLVEAARSEPAAACEMSL
jgi:hypothetical protein